MRLSGLQRLGVVFSVIFVVGFTFLNIQLRREAYQSFYTLAFDSCYNSFPIRGEDDAVSAKRRECIDRISSDRNVEMFLGHPVVEGIEIGVAALIPVWLIAWLCVASARWVAAGFK